MKGERGASAQVGRPQRGSSASGASAERECVRFPLLMEQGRPRQAGPSPQSAVLTGGRVTCVSRRGRREPVLRPGLPAAARLVQALSRWGPPPGFAEARPGRRRPRGWAGRGPRPRGHCACALQLPRPSPAGAPVEDDWGRRGFGPG